MKVPLEDAEQYEYIKWLESNKIIYFAVPNIVKTAATLKTKIRKIRFWQQRKREGVKKGVPDLVVFLPNKMLFVEMKRQKGSSTSPEQKEWSNTINKYKYAKSVICKGTAEAISRTEEAINEEIRQD